MEARIGYGTSGSPLAATLERISVVSMGEEGIEFSALLGVPEEPGWVTVSGLAADADLIGGIMARIGRTYGTTDRAYAGTSLLRHYLWRMLVPAVAAFLTERRLPDLRAHNVALRFAENGFVERLAFVGPRFAALPGDPDSGHPDAAVLSSEQESLGWLRGALAEAHLPPLFDALRRSRSRRGRRAMWATAVDVCAEAFMFVGRALGGEAEALGFAEALLAGSPPLSGPTNYYALEHDGGVQPTRVRNTCCLYYKVGDGTCFTCPRTSDEERLRRLAGEA